MPSDSQSGKLRLDRETLVPLGLVCSLLVGAWWIGARMSDVQHEVALLRRDLNQMQTMTGESITRRDRRACLQLLKAQNPVLVVPELPG